MPDENPGAQRQTSEEDAPTVVELLLAGQRLQAVAPEAAWKVKAGHGTQLCSADALYLPGAHWTHL